MFLRPHHFQAAQRHIFHVNHLSEKWDQHYNWGLRTAELDLDALANQRLVFHRLQARLRDGTLVSIPEDGLLPVIDLKDAFGEEKSLTVYLGVPISNLGKANVSSNGAVEGARYMTDTQDLEDENTGLNPQSIQVRLLNLKMLLSTHDHAGYEVLPVARVKPADRAEATPELDITYIPPVLACDAWHPLLAGIIQQLYDRIGQKIQLQSDRVISGNITFDSQAAGDPGIFALLRVLNEAYCVLGTMTFAQGLHPFPAYLELCRIVGQLSIFGPERRPPELPRYDHDDLGGCYYQVKKYIDALLEEGPKQEYEERPFVGAGLRMQVSMEPRWMESIYQMFVGVKSSLTPEECINILTRGSLDMKIGSSERVDSIFKFGSAGLRFQQNPRPPRALPNIPGLIYFEVSRSSQLEEWQHVQKSLTLAIRMNENKIAGDIQGKKVFTVKTSGNQTTNLQFTLYVVKQEAPAPKRS
jgi:type VI secretion system protein ImpJ